MVQALCQKLHTCRKPIPEGQFHHPQGVSLRLVNISLKLFPLSLLKLSQQTIPKPGQLPYQSIRFRIVSPAMLTKGQFPIPKIFDGMCHVFTSLLFQDMTYRHISQPKI